MNQKTTPKDFFLNLGALVALYVVIISIISLVFSLVNKYFPDPSLYALSYDGDLSVIRTAISCLIVAFPLKIYLSSLIDKDIATAPEKKNLWIKKWSTYLTLFLTALTIAIDIIVLINEFLGGEITLRFIFKAVILLLVALFVFMFYLHELKRTSYPQDSKTNLMIWFATGAIILSIVGGFIIVDSPSSERLKKLDERRVSDLSSIQNQMVFVYWQNKRILPENLEVLNDPISSFVVPVDPVTYLPYEYRKINNVSFELCAVFDESSRQENKELQMNAYFLHDQGRTCFTYVIDPELYPQK